MKNIYDLKFLDELISEYFIISDDFTSTISKAMNEAVKNGGKRIRPLLILETYKLFSKDRDISKIKPFMAAIEFIHTFSLIHDDLPAIDNDELRRGKESTWVTYGEDIAILAGDALSVEAFSIISKAMLKQTDINELLKYTKSLNILAKKTGIEGMIAGETLDVIKSGKALTKKELEYIYLYKTSALIEASMLIGAIMAGANEDDLIKIEKIARNIGLAFQIKDDILDETSSIEELGKNIGSDKANNKTTYLSIYGMEKSVNDVEELSNEAINILRSFNLDTKNLEKIVTCLIYRNK